MSLPEAINEIADAMDEKAEGAMKSINTANGNAVGLAASLGSTALLLQSFARELRTAVKASAGQPNAIPFGINPTDPSIAATQHRAAIEAAKGEFRGKKPIEAVEQMEPQMYPMVGGGHNGDTYPLPVAAPEGAKVPVGGEVYLLAGGKLVYSKEETMRFQAGRA